MKSLLWITDSSLQEAILCTRDGQQVKEITINLNVEDLRKIECDELIVFLPANYINAKSFSSDTNNKEKRLAIFIAEFGHEIVDSPNELSFRYSKENKCFYWLKIKILEDLFAKLASLDMKITLLPDFFLLPPGETNPVPVLDRLLIRLKNGEGYSLEHNQLQHFKELFSNDDSINLSFDSITWIKSLAKKNFLRFIGNFFTAKAIDINFYNNPYSIAKFLFWLGLTKKKALLMCAMLIFSWIFLSIESIYLQKNISQTIEDTKKIFIEVNPKFTKLINTKAQIDQLVGQPNNTVPQTTANKKLLSEILPFLSTLNVSSLIYKPKSNEISLTINNISSFELGILTEAAKLKALKLNTDRLIIDSAGNFSGEVNVFL